MALLARHCHFEKTAQTSPQPGPVGAVVTLCGLFALGMGAALFSGALNPVGSAIYAWHHRGAYLSPVYALIGGGTPFRDFPVQYGMGPTLLLAAFCKGSCWSEIYWVTATFNALYLATLAGSLCG